MSQVDHHGRSRLSMRGVSAAPLFRTNADSVAPKMQTSFVCADKAPTIVSIDDAPLFLFFSTHPISPGESGLFDWPAGPVRR